MATITYLDLDAITTADSSNDAFVQTPTSFVILNISDPENPVVIGSYAGPYTRGYTSGVAVDENYAYVRGENDLYVYNISNPTAPILVGDYSQLGGGDPSVHELAVSSGFAYIPDGIGTIDILNVSNPSSPQLVGSYSATSGGDGAWPIAVSGNDLYVADGPQVDVVDVSNAASPTLLGSCAISGIPEAIRVSGHYVYVASTTGFYIVDASNPSAPTLVGSYQVGASPFGSSDGFSDVQVLGNVAYLLDDNSGQLLKLDISNPQAPTLMESINAGVPSFFPAFSLTGQAALIADFDSLQIVNFGASASPGDLAVVSVSSTGGGTDDVSVVGNKAYVTDSLSGLHVFDTSNPKNPSEVGSFAGLSTATTVLSDGHYAYVAEKGIGVAILDVSNPSSITLDATYSLTGNESDPTQLALDGQYLFATAADDSVVRIINVSVPTNPALANSIAITGPTALTIAGNYAYIGTSAGQAEIAIYDISNPSSPLLVGTYTGGLKSTDHIAISGHYAYIADDTTGLSILDISNPASPELVARYGQSFWDVHIDGDHAYLSGPPGLSELDVTNPATPELMGSISLPQVYANFSFDEDYAYVADGALSVVQLPQPSLSAPVIDTASSILTATVSKVGNAATSSAPDTAQGIISFTDSDLATTAATVLQESIVFKNAQGAVQTPPASVSLASLESAFQLGSVTSGSEGSVNWTYSIANSQLSWLGTGQTLTLTSTVQINDGQGDTTNQNVTITINGADDLPVAVRDTVSVQQKSSITEGAAQGVLANDSDPVLEDALTVTAVSTTSVFGTNHPATAPVSSILPGILSGEYGTLTLNSDGSYSYLETAKHVPTSSALDVFSYTVSDGNGGTATSTLTIDITPLLLPTVTSVSASPASGDISIGNSIVITLHMSEGVVVHGAPTLALNDGGAAIYDSAHSDPASGILEFDYTVAVGQSTSDLTVNGVSLTHGTSIQNIDGVSANLTAAQSASLGVQVNDAASFLQEVETNIAQANQYALTTTFADGDLRQALKGLVSSVAQDAVEGVLQEIGGATVDKIFDGLSDAQDLIHITRDLLSGNFADALQFVVDQAAGDALKSISVPHEYDAAKIAGIFIRDYEAAFIAYFFQNH